jgi:adenosylcobinamide kinase/adenosylcobinamide-phosphate guanylyltransferase
MTSSPLHPPAATESILVIGACKSGKSRHALALAAALAPPRKLFVATCVPRDDEMHQRVARHQAERGPEWRTLEEPLGLAEAIRAHSGEADLILVDCLTLWLSNLMLAEESLAGLDRRLDELVAALRAARCPVILVSNEVGAGIVPENRLARRFRDAAGMMNQTIAAGVDRVTWVVAGIPVTVKPQTASWG